MCIRTYNIYYYILLYSTYICNLLYCCVPKRETVFCFKVGLYTQQKTKSERGGEIPGPGPPLKRTRDYLSLFFAGGHDAMVKMNIHI